MSIEIIEKGGARGGTLTLVAAVNRIIEWGRTGLPRRHSKFYGECGCLSKSSEKLI